MSFAKDIQDFIKHLRPLQVEDILGKHRPRPLAKVGVVTLINNFAGSGISLVSVVVLSHLLPPSAFGLFAMAAFILTMLQAFCGQGVTESLVQAKELHTNLLSAFFWINCAIGSSMGILLAVSGPWIAEFYNNSELGPICVVLGFVLILQNIKQSQLALLKRAMKAELIAIVTVVPLVAQLVISVVCALSGFEVWSLVFGAAFAAIIGQLLILYCVRWKPDFMLRANGIRSLFSYGFRATAGSLVTFLSFNIQTLVLGYYATPAAVGYYNRAQSIYQQPIRQFAWPLVGAMLPSLSAISDQKGQLLSLVNRTTWLLSLVLMPVAVCVMVFGDWIVAGLLGHQWAVTGEVIRWVAVAQFTMTANAALTRANAAIGRPSRGLWVNLLTLPIIVLGIVEYASAGVVQVAMLIALVRLCAYPVLLTVNLRGSGLNHKKYLKSVGLLFLFGIVTIGVSLLIRMPVGNYLESVFLRLGFTIVWLGLLYIFFCWFFRLSPIGRSVLEWVRLKFGQRIRLPQFLFPRPVNV